MEFIGRIIIWIQLLISSLFGGQEEKLNPLSGASPTLTAEVSLNLEEKPILKSTITPGVKIKPKPTEDSEPWGVAKQLDEYTWTMKIEQDARMAEAGEILTALNEYRKTHGSQILRWDDSLAKYAQSRADSFFENKTTDKHEGFKKFLEEEEGFEKLGFSWLGENSSWGYQLEAVHLIEWVFAGDEPHNKNQLDNKWDSVGIGVKGSGVDIIFGTGKM